jgi:hypothetical protein
MDRLRYAGQPSSAWLARKRLRSLRRSLALIETAIDALRAYAKIKHGDACHLSFVVRRRPPPGSPAKPVQRVQSRRGRYN